MPKNKKNTTTKPLFSPGHRACAGCGQVIAVRAVTEALGPDVIIANATGCLEVVSTPYPQSAWGMPWIHSLFENAAAVASGISAALKQQKKDKQVKVVAQGGDGGTFDIGFGLISGMWERGEDILYICYDNEAYMNTGMQASAATPWGAHTTTTPSGKGEDINALGSHLKKKDMVAIALAHGLNYVAQTSAGYPADIAEKVKKAIATPGPSYLQILVPCIPGWKIEPSQTIKIAKLAVQTGHYPAIEYINGNLSKSLKIPQNQPKVEEYLRLQGRFSHLFKTEQGKKQIAYIQTLADNNIKKYNLKQQK